MLKELGQSGIDYVTNSTSQDDLVMRIQKVIECIKGTRKIVEDRIDQLTERYSKCYSDNGKKSTDIGILHTHGFGIGRFTINSICEPRRNNEWCDWKRDDGTFGVAVKLANG